MCVKTEGRSRSSQRDIGTLYITRISRVYENKSTRTLRNGIGPNIKIHLESRLYLMRKIFPT